MTFGYECEYFLLRDGQIIKPVPSRFDRDATQNLVEVRSSYYSDPYFTEQSFRERREALKALAKREGFKLAALDCDGEDTAGFHVHFGYQGLCDMPRLIGLLDVEFAKDITRALRPLSSYRMKPYGFEYRSLPSSIDFRRLTKLLSERI